MVISRNAGVITLILNSTEIELVQWIDDIYGTDELNAYLSRYLEQKTAQKNENDRSEFWALVKDHPDIQASAIAAVATKVKL